MNTRLGRRGSHCGAAVRELGAQHETGIRNRRTDETDGLRRPFIINCAY